VPQTGEVFAVKFIHKRYAIERGKITLRQITAEVSLHRHCGYHPNLIQFYDSAEDEVWTWIGMEFASGGDLFDKIEPDVGVAEDICHFYFTQLVAGVSYIHGQGIAHRGRGTLPGNNCTLSPSLIGGICRHQTGEYTTRRSWEFKNC